MLRDNFQRYERQCKGWLLGNFEGSLLSTPYEVGIKTYKAGETNGRHWHKLASEINVVLSGRARFILDDREETAVAGDIIIIEPNEPSGFIADENTSMLIIKTVSDPKDKYAE